MNFLDYMEGPLEDMAVKMSDLQDNMRTLQALNEQFVQFNVSFGTFLQGIKANTRIVDFPERTKPDRKPASISIKKIMDSLPSRFHDQPHKGHIDMIVKGLFKNKDGLYLHDVIREAAISRTKAIDYLNVLVQSGHLIKLSQK
ncbi:DASH complex subunit dam1, partial [Dimargaris cristalligena]